MAEPKMLAKLAVIGHLLNADWPEKSLRTYLELNHISDDGYQLTVAAVACWADPATATPARLKENGPWWRAARAAASEERGALKGPPKRGEDCELHPGQWRDACAGCRADQLLGEEQTRGSHTSSHTSGDYTRGAAACRAALTTDRQEVT